MQKGTFYVAYGSNLSLTQMKRRCPTASVIGLSELKDYELVFKGSREHAVATIEPKAGSCVPVIIWDIRKADERALDRYEGYPHLYEKKQVEVSLGKETIDAMVYVMTPGHSFGHPSPYYLDIIRNGYEKAGFDFNLLQAAVVQSEQIAREQERQQGGMSGMNTLQ